MINKDTLQKKVHVLEQSENNIGQTVQLVSVDSGYDDEISLVDLWLVLSRRRNILLAIILAFLAAGISFALMKPILYQYSAVVQVGLKGSQGTEEKGLSYIESPANVLEKLTKSYIPLALTEYLQQNPDIKSAPKVKAAMAKKSDLITLEVRGKEADSVAFRGILNNIIGYIQKDHQPQMDITRSQYQRDLQRAEMVMAVLENPLTLKEKQKQLEIDLLSSRIKMDNLKDQRLTRVVKQKLVTQKKEQTNKLAGLADEHKRLTSELARLDDVDKLLEKRVTDLSTTIKNELKNRQASVSSINSGPEAMTVLLLDNQIQANRNQLASLEERLDIKQHSKREKINNQLKANARSQELHQKLLTDINSKLQKIDIDNSHAQQQLSVKQTGLQLSMDKVQLEHKNSILTQQQKIDGLRFKLKGLKDTQSLTPPMQSLEPVGIGKKIIVVISLLAGLFMGVFSVFFLEFLSKTKEKTQSAD